MPGFLAPIAMELTSHKTEAVYRRYAITSEADKVEAIRKVAAFQEQEKQGEKKVLPLGEVRQK